MTEIAWILIVVCQLAILAGALIWIFTLLRRLSRKASALRLAHELLDKAEGLTHFGSWQYDLVADKVHWSARVFAIHHRPVEWGEPGFADALGYYHPEDRQRVWAALDRSIKAGMPFEFAARLVLGEGEIKQVISRGTCHRNSHGQIDKLFGIFIETAHVVRLADFVNDNPTGAQSRQR